jgi:NAD(P)-dependent dehydrogenase (short-subunit alcohol dehydrogenase family)
MIGTLAGHCGIVTSATTPWGRAVALELARDGARLAIGYRGFRGADLQAAERLARDVACLGGEGVPLRVPLGVPDELDAALDCLATCWGRLDFVIDLDADSLVSGAALPLMLRRNHGWIVAVGQLRGSSVPFDRRQLRELAEHGVAVNCVAVGALGSGPGSPSNSDRRTQPDGRTCVGTVAQAGDVAAMVYFLLTQGVCITGQLIDLSGIQDDPPQSYAPPTWSRFDSQLLRRLGPQAGSRVN